MIEEGFKIGLDNDPYDYKWWDEWMREERLDEKKSRAKTQMVQGFTVAWALIVAGIFWSWGFNPLAVAIFIILALPTLIRESRS